MELGEGDVYSANECRACETRKKKGLEGQCPRCATQRARESRKFSGDLVMADEKTEDAKVFGEDVIIYCGQHLNPHATGWCTVSLRDKVSLGIKFGPSSKSYDEAMREAGDKCQRLGLKLFKG